MDKKWEDITIDPLQEHNAESHRITVESIQSALANLLADKKLSEISIKEIVEKAGVSRSAFYRNYQSKDEVLQSIVYTSFRDMISQINKNIDPSSREDWIKVIENMAIRCAKLYSVMTPDAWQSVTMLQCLNEYFTDMFPRTLESDTVYFRFIMGGTHNCIQYWLDSGMKETPKEIAEMILSCVWRQ